MRTPPSGRQRGFALAVFPCIRPEINREARHGGGCPKPHMATINAIAAMAMSARAKTATATSGATPFRSIHGLLIWFLHSLDAKRTVEDTLKEDGGPEGMICYFPKHLGATSRSRSPGRARPVNTCSAEALKPFPSDTQCIELSQKVLFISMLA